MRRFMDLDGGVLSCYTLSLESIEEWKGERITDMMVFRCLVNGEPIKSLF